jgi:hypothetical protein
MPSEIKCKKTFGTATIDHTSPAAGDQVPPLALNIHISFEEGLKLHLEGNCWGTSTDTTARPKPVDVPPSTCVSI